VPAVTRFRSVLVLVVVLVAVAGCTKKDSLVLLDLRVSGPLSAPIARIRLSAPGWKTRTVDGTIGLDGFRVGYYGPGDGSSVSVLAEALDSADCVLGSGTATAAALKAGETSAATKLFIRALPNVCVDAGTGEDASVDAGQDAPVDAGTDAEMDAASDAPGDSEVNADAGADAEPDTTNDANGATDTNDDASTADAASD